MKIPLSHLLGAILVIISCLLITSTYAQFPPPVTETDLTATPDLPDWPPATETDEQVTQPTTTTTALPPGVTTQPPPNGGDNPPGEDDPAWMVTAIIFIVLTVVLAILAIYLYVSRPQLPLIKQSGMFKLPRVDPHPR